MKKKFLLMLLITSSTYYAADAQIQQGNVLVGSDISSINLSLNKGGNFNISINPKAAWFIKDNTALGGYVNLGLSGAKGAGTDISYGIGALGRYYINKEELNITKHSRFFVEANAGIEGFNPSVGDNTNGLGLGLGPGLAYFVTPNIGLEGLLKYNAIVGFGQSTTASALSLGIGFQIYLPGKKIKSTIQNPKQ